MESHHLSLQPPLPEGSSQDGGNNLRGTRVKLHAVVLAAGRSVRMGTQKLLLPLGGKPVIAGIVDELLRSPVQQIVVIVGHDAAEIQSALTGRSVSFAKNPDPAGDMLSSIRCGVRALPPECEAMLIVLGDQPNLSATLVERLLAEFARRRSGIVLPAHNGHRGHPVLLMARFRDELLARHDGVGLRGLLDAHAVEIATLETPTSVELEDLDTQADYRRHWDRLAAQ